MMTGTVKKYGCNHWLRIFLAVIVFSLMRAGSGMTVDLQTDARKRQKVEELYAEYKKSFPKVRDIDPRAAMHLARQQEVIFIDVREPEEQQVSMLPDSITDKEFLAAPEKYSGYIKIGYCTISYRSGIFARKLMRKGIEIVNLRGGLLAWVHAGGKVYHRNKVTNRIHVYGRKWNLGPELYEAIW